MPAIPDNLKTEYTALRGLVGALIRGLYERSDQPDHLVAAIQKHLIPVVATMKLGDEKIQLNIRSRANDIILETLDLPGLR